MRIYSVHSSSVLCRLPPQPPEKLWIFYSVSKSFIGNILELQLHFPSPEFTDILLFPILILDHFLGSYACHKIKLAPRLISHGRFWTTIGFTKKVLVMLGKRIYIPLETPFTSIACLLAALALIAVSSLGIPNLA